MVILSSPHTDTCTHLHSHIQKEYGILSLYEASNENRNAGKETFVK